MLEADRRKSFRRCLKSTTHVLSTECRPTVYIIYSRAVLSRVNEEHLPIKELLYQLECQCVFGIGLPNT